MIQAPTITEADVVAALRDVYDPEIPNLSLVDLGIYRGVSITPEGLAITITPTFVGCPAIDYMQEQIVEHCATLWPDTPVQVKVSHDRAWTSDQISEEGRVRLKQAGFAPPPRGTLIRLEPLVECPYCNSRNTMLENAFGPTLCRAIYYCKSCRQPFEQFKAV
ncbi:MAG TPA: 1,2-phenylacetyl-CoA epoxidase subunit PaaD [Chloroflexia bacterium]|nr:1,2-phenylacetyl-CoA epoxidase subunit PaaD [Chloroflexia bacterium]